MSKNRFVYNPHTLQYEPYKVPFKNKIYKATGYLCMTILTAVGIYFTIDKFFPSAQELAMERELNQMKYHYNSISDDYADLSQRLQNLQDKDANVHRMIFGIDPLDKGVWNGGVGGVDRYDHLDVYQSGEMMSSSLEHVEKLKRQLHLQNKSLDTLYRLAVNREKRLSSIPSIKPIDENKLKRSIKNLSGYGIRLHPVHKVKKLHQGIDFTAPRGTHIQATGEGTIVKVENRKSGYGKNVIIDHGYGYRTLYAHMQKVYVKKGEKVKKGQQIGEVGSTGTSTAPHLHYEVRINNKPVNPIDYCLDGLSPEEYKEILDKASVENQSFD